MTESNDMNHPEWDELLRVQEITRETLRQRGIPHLEISVINDFGEETPLAHTAYSYESLINTLLAVYTTTGDEKYIGLLGYTTNSIDNINGLTADLIVSGLRERKGATIIEDMLKYMQSFHGHHNEEYSDETEIPNAFTDAFKDEESEDESD